MSRPLRCGYCWLPCCLQRIKISTPSGQLLGKIKQRWSIFGFPKFSVLDEDGTEVYRILGPWWTCTNQEYVIKSSDESQDLGCIRKVFSELFNEAFTDADNFEIDFPAGCHVEMKAVLIGAAILIDFMYYESHPNPDFRVNRKWLHAAKCECQRPTSKCEHTTITCDPKDRPHGSGTKTAKLIGIEATGHP